MRGTCVFLLLWAVITPGSCNCQCGYAVNTFHSEPSATFTEIIETDFLHVEDFQSDWIAQTYEVTPEASRGPRGKAAQVENVQSNSIPSSFDWGGPGVRGPNPGLELWSRASLVDVPDAANGSMVPMAEIVSARNDILYGSFRVGMKITEVDGTCGAFFFYRNDSEEIDMEFLSKQQQQQHDVQKGFANLVVQSPPAGSVQPGSVDNNTSPEFFDLHSLDFNPAEGYNEFRFDWLSDRVDFYANGRLLKSTRENVPDAAGSLHLIHWSNGDEGWSGGPPGEDAALVISYVKAYFNSSSGETSRESLRSCEDGGKICGVPSQEISPNHLGMKGNDTGRTFFFTEQGGDLDDQDTGIGGHRSSNGMAAGPSVMWISLLLGMWSFAC